MEASRGLGCKHSHLASVVEKAASFNDGRHLPQWLKAPLFAGRDVHQFALLDLETQRVAGAYLFAKPIGTFKRDQVTTVDGIAKEDSSVKLGNHGLDTGCIESNGCMFSR